MKCIWKCFPFGKNIRQGEESDDTQPRTLQVEFPVFYHEGWAHCGLYLGFLESSITPVTLQLGKIQRVSPNITSSSPPVKKHLFVPAPLGLAGAALTQESLD